MLLLCVGRDTELVDPAYSRMKDCIYICIRVNVAAEQPQDSPMLTNSLKHTSPYS